MFGSKSTDNLAFVSRQLSHLLDDAPLEAALARLGDAAPGEYSADIAYLRGLLTGSEEAAPTLGPNPFHALARLSRSVPGPKHTLFREFLAYVQQSKVVFETYWAGVAGFLWYLAAVSVVALLVAIIFGVFVFPSFESMFSQFGDTLPQFTRTVFGLGVAGVPLFAVVFALIFGVVVLVIVRFHKRAQQLAPLPRWPSWAPVVGKLAESYNLGLFLNYVRMLRVCGVEAGQAVADAARAANQPDWLTYDELASRASGFAQLPVLTELGVAARLGTFDAEIAHQCEQHVTNLSLVLVEVRDRSSLVLRIALYLFVAALVVAMYLPIFQMGSVIAI